MSSSTFVRFRKAADWLTNGEVEMFFQSLVPGDRVSEAMQQLERHRLGWLAAPHSQASPAESECFRLGQLLSITATAWLSGRP